MNSRICITLSKPLPVSGSVVAVLAFLITGCGSSAPAPATREQDATLVQVHQPGENGEGTISFHYSNKSTDANLAIDLGNTDLYMEMSGEPPKLANGEPAVTEEKRPPPKPKVAKPQAQEQEQEDPDQGEPEPPKTAMRKRAEARSDKADGKPDGKKEPEPKQELQLPEEEQGNFEDVTSRVLAGIRKAQELFYQKRYPEALQAVKSSLDARPTAEGYALAGSIHYMMGQGGMARRQWMEALRMNPDMPSVVNMLEKTRTPGGRGSPSPRPILPRPVQRSAPAPLPEAEHPPFPEVYIEPAYNYPAAPTAPPVAVPASAPQAPVSEAAESGAEAEPAAVAPEAPVAPAPVTTPASAHAAAATPVAAQPTPAKATPAKAAPAKATSAEPHAPDAHADSVKPAKTKLPSAKASNAAKEGKAK